LDFMATTDGLLDWRWERAREFLPFDLDGLAVETGALTRRRGVCGGEALTRVLLLCGLPNMSLSTASLLAGQSGLAKLSKVALFNRLVGSEALLKLLFESTLGFTTDAGEKWSGLSLVAVDATSLSGPAAKGTDQKLHTVYDISRGLPRWVEITDRRGGETLERHWAFGKGDLILGDAGYGYNKSFLRALNSGANMLMRFNFETVTLMDEDGNRIWAEEVNQLVPEEDPLELIVRLPDWEHSLRAVGSRNDEGKPVWLLTDLSEKQLPTSQARQLYRKRWQIELFFKRMKSLLDLDELPTRDGPSVRPWIWAKLTLASLAVLLAHERFSPWGRPDQEEQTLALGPYGMRIPCHHKGAPGTRSTHQKRAAKRQEETQRKARQAIMLLEA
jgi:hypothetical protein